MSATTRSTATQAAAIPPAGTATAADANVAVELPYQELPPPKLRAGLVTTVAPFEPTIVFRVPTGWNGSQDDVSFGVGKGVDLQAEDFDRASIYVYRSTIPYSKLTAKLRSMPGLNVLTTKPAPRVFGYPGRVYEVTVGGERVGLEPIGIFDELNAGTARLTFYNVDHTALKVDVSGDTAADRAEAERVIRSFEIHK